MLLKLFMKLSIPIRLITDILGTALLALLLWPALTALNQWDPGILKTTFNNHVGLNLLYALILGPACAFGGFTIAYMTRHFYPGKWLLFFSIGLLILMPETVQILTFGPIAQIFSGKDKVLFSQLSACLWPTLLATLVGFAMIRSVGSDKLLIMKHLGAAPGSSLFRFMLPQFLKPLLFLGLLFSCFILGHGISLNQEMSLKSYNLSWLFIGPLELMGQAQHGGMGYTILLGISLVTSFVCLIQFSAPIKSHATASAQSNKPVKRKKPKKRKPLPNTTPTVASETPQASVKQEDPVTEVIQTDMPETSEPEPVQEPEPLPEPESAAPKKKMGLKISLGKKQGDS